MAIKNHPLMITLKDAVAGNGFLASITLHGRTLVREEDAKFWMYGVSPSGLAESGESLEQAFLRFRNRYKETLFDIAEEGGGFEDFKAAVESFFNESPADPEYIDMWNDALAEIRAGEIAPSGAFSSLPRVAFHPEHSGLVVERVDGRRKQFSPDDNVADAYSLAKAA